MPRVSRRVRELTALLNRVMDWPSDTELASSSFWIALRTLDEISAWSINS